MELLFPLPTVLELPRPFFLFPVEGAIGIPGHRKLILPKGIPELTILLGSPGLPGKGVELCFHLPEDIVQTQDVLIGGLQLPLRRLLARLVFGNARRFLDKLPPFLRLCLNQRSHAVLFHDRIGPGAHPGAHKEFPDVEETAGQAVDGIFALAVPQEPPGDYHLGTIMVWIRKGKTFRRQRHENLRHPDRFRLLSAVEDYILHPDAPETLDPLLPNHPADGVHHVALPAAVGTHDGAHPHRKVEGHLVPKGLKSLDFQIF